MMKILKGNHFASAALLLAVGAIALLLIMPIAALVLSWSGIITGDAASFAVLWEMASTVLPSYAWESLRLCAMVAVIAGVMGTSSAVLVTIFDFQGRRWFEWALLLPLAMPAYVVAYAYTDFLQFSGPLQTWLRDSFSLQGRLLPDIRSLWGAAFVFAFCLYPYVYLLVRTALSERAAHLMEAARLLGSPLHIQLTRVALPLARPAIAAGIALVLMETLADFGVVSYFGVQTFSAGIYKAWLAMDNRIAAAQLATVLLLVVAVLIKLEQHAQARMRFVNNKGALAGAPKTARHNGAVMVLRGLPALSAQILCLLPVLLGFLLPVALMLLTLYQHAQTEAIQIPWAAFAGWSINSLRLGLLTAALAVACALGLTFAQRLHKSTAVSAMVKLTALGYAVPGTVIVVGLLLPLTTLQTYLPWLNTGYWLTATSVGLIWAYLARFNAVAVSALQTGYSRIPTSLDESARLLGTQGFGILQYVHAPLLKRSVLTAALLVFVDVMKELPATLVLRPFNTDTLAVVTYQLARDERLGEAALPALALVLVGLIPVLFLNRKHL